MTQHTIDLVSLLPRCYRTTAAVLAAIPAERLDAPSPCEAWTLRQVANHLVGGLDLFGRIAEGQTIDPAEYEAADDPRAIGAADYRAVAERAAAAFARPGALEQEYPFVFGPTPGFVIATISLSESLVHGWDLARGAGLPYAPDAAVVDAVAAFAAQDDGEQGRANGMYGPVRPVAPDAPAFTALLGRLGRRA
jgi:uncharacterized protein (TIGR03086 family)